MGDLIEITTWPKHLNSFYKVTSNGLAFEIKANGNAAIGLSRQPADNCDFWIVIGEGQRSWIKKSGSNREIVRTPDILTMEEYRKFWLTWRNGKVRLGREGSSETIVSCTNDVYGLKYVTFSVIEERNPVHWRIEIPPASEKVKYREISGSELHWVPFGPGQELPAEPLVGGVEGEILLIARARHRGSLTPGKFVPLTGLSYIPWGGEANEKNDFEILCGFDGFWVPTTENKIPVGALVAGYSEDALERLYIGRAQHEGHLIPGKVQPSHKVCYIPYDGREVGVKKYEILATSEQNERSVNKMYHSLVGSDNEPWDSDYSNETDEENVPEVLWLRRCSSASSARRGAAPARRRGLLASVRARAAALVACVRARARTVLALLYDISTTEISAL